MEDNQKTKKLKVAILSSYTTKNFGEFLKKNLEDLQPEIKYGGYNQFIQELLDETSWLSNWSPQFTLILLSTRTLFPNLVYDLISRGYEETLCSCMDKITLIKSSISNSKVSSRIILTSLDYPTYSPKGFMDYSDEKGVYSIITQCNESLRDLSRESPNLTLLNFEEFCSILGKENLTDEKLYYLGKIFLNQFSAEKLSKRLSNLIRVCLGETKKVLIVDLDNTIWGGVIGEDGIDRIVLDNSPVGEIYQEIQKILLNLKKTGTLLVVCSKNNPSEAIEMIRSEKMILKEEDFVSLKINWKPKSENIRDISKELNLGLDSFVFLDDNPSERGEVKSMLPAVEVIDFPEDIAKLPNVLKSLPYFEKISLTKEDLIKGELYLKNKEREKLQGALGLKDYLMEIQTKILVEEDSMKDVDRISQLINKTNQFNLRTKRYTREEVVQLIENPRSKIYSVKVWDKYGELGLTGVIILKEKEDKSWFIDNFLMSCRVLSRDIELQFFNEIISKLPASTKLFAEYIKSQKNSQVEKFYEKLGFKLESQSGEVKTYFCLASDLKKSEIGWVEVLNE